MTSTVKLMIDFKRTVISSYYRTDILRYVPLFQMFTESFYEEPNNSFIKKRTVSDPIRSLWAGQTLFYYNHFLFLCS